MAKMRADLLVVARGLAPSPERARALILAGRVFSGEARVDKAGSQLPDDAPLEVRGNDLPYVSRGGLKLEAALDAFSVDPAGLTVADFGASTGGFTDCVLQRGAVRVYAIDVGYGQLHNKLRQDDRVVVMERTNARHLTPDDLPDVVDLLVIDASFIGLDKLLPAAKGLLQPHGEIVALIKPQFEVGKGDVGEGGVVRDLEVRESAIVRVEDYARSLGFAVEGRIDCPVHGPKGNVEALVHLTLASRQ
ncbi:MAG: TlyA family rRNA (cytidine-2'-O)-methyltransferase [Deltaproteobacteria bacterium]|nr:MAG: TlyA family rRNA (cytidine-2'-O)-methyltransferase [Deltaproteobacteria bacterium]